MKVLTANTNRTGAAKTPLLVEFLRQESIQLASLQEVDINVESAVGFCTHWKSQGCTAVLAPLDADRCQHRVALISSLPIKPVTLGNDFDCSRVAAGLVGNLPKTSLLVESLFEKTVTFGGPVLALGDWNAVEEEGVLARHLASGRLIPLDDGDRSDLRYTNPTRTRRIDYGVSTAHIRADAVLHYDRDDISVHLCVGYSLDLETWRECAALPNFKTVGHTDQQVIQSRFADAWAQPVLEALLADADVDQALAHLYTVAETCLAPECATDAKATSRAHLWDPVQKKSCPHHATVDGHASLALHTLRKLSGQLRQLRCQPFDCSLRAATRKRCGDLRQRLPDCPFFDLDDLETTLAKVDALLRDLSAQEKQAHVARWKAEAQDVTAATAWVKRWASRRVELDAPPCELAKAPTDIHPASIVRTQSQVWMDKWTCDSESFNSEGLAEILSTLPRPAQGSIDLTITGQELFEAVKKMRKKAVGPDRWGPEILHLPLEWWTGLGQVWTLVLNSGKVPKLWKRAIIVLVPKKHAEYRPLALTSFLWRAGARILCKRMQPWISSWCSPQAAGGAPGRGTLDAHGVILQSWHRGARAYVQQDLSAYFDSIRLLLPF